MQNKFRRAGGAGSGEDDAAVFGGSEIGVKGGRRNEFAVAPHALGSLNVGDAGLFVFTVDDDCFKRPELFRIDIGENSLEIDATEPRPENQHSYAGAL